MGSETNVIDTIEFTLQRPTSTCNCDALHETPYMHDTTILLAQSVRQLLIILQDWSNYAFRETIQSHSRGSFTFSRIITDSIWLSGLGGIETT